MNTTAEPARKNQLKWAVAAMLLAGGLASTQANATVTNATVINVNFTDLAAQDLNGTSWSSAVAPGGYAGKVWTDTSSNTGANLPYSDSNLGNSSVGFSISPVMTVADNWNSGSPLTMLLGGMYGNNGTGITLTLSNVPAGTYDLYLASDFAAGNGGVFTLTGYGSLTSAGGDNSSWIEGTNYVHFAGISPVGGDIIVTITKQSSGSYQILNGFQLVQDVPEPSAVALLSVGGMLLWLRRRNR